MAAVDAVVVVQIASNASVQLRAYPRTPHTVQLLHTVSAVAVQLSEMNKPAPQPAQVSQRDSP